MDYKRRSKLNFQHNVNYGEMRNFQQIRDTLQFKKLNKHLLIKRIDAMIFRAHINVNGEAIYCRLAALLLLLL